MYSIAWQGRIKAQRCISIFKSKILWGFYETVNTHTSLDTPSIFNHLQYFNLWQSHRGVHTAYGTVNEVYPKHFVWNHFQFSAAQGKELKWQLLYPTQYISISFCLAVSSSGAPASDVPFSPLHWCQQKVVLLTKEGCSVMLAIARLLTLPYYN